VGTTSSCLEPELASSLFGAAGGACESTSTCYKYVAEESEIQAAWIPLFEPTVPLCSTQDFQVEIKNTKLGRLIDLDFNFNLPPGLNYIPGSFEYDYAAGSNNWQPLPDPTVSGTNPFGNVLTILDNSMPPILQNGLPGIAAEADSNRIYIRFKAETICDEYVSPTPLYFNATAQNACEARIQSPLTINPDLIVTNADPLDAAQFLISTEPLKYLCGEPVQVAVNGINLSNTGGVTQDTKACFSFPPELAFVTETSLPNGYEQICFDLPDGMQIQEFFAFFVELTPDNSTSCGEVLFLAEVSSDIVDQLCEANGQLCTVFVNNTINDQTVLTITPPVEIANLDVTVLCDEDPTVSVFDYTASLEGVTTSDYIGNVTIEWFNDVDGDGVVSAFDMLLDTDMLFVNVPSGQTVDYQGSVEVQENVSCPVIVKLTVELDCNCISTEYYYNIAPTPEFFDEDPVVLCPGEDFEIQTCRGYDFDINGTPVFPDANGVVTVSLAPGQGVNAPVFLHVESQQAACGGDFYFSIYQLEDFSIGPFTAYEVCSEECTTIDVNLPPEWEQSMTFLWTPSTYLSDPTVPRPQICNPQADIVYTLTIDNGRCGTNATLPVNVLDAVMPEITYDGFEQCFLEYDPATLTVTPAGLSNYEFHYVNGPVDVVLQSGTSNTYSLLVGQGQFYAIADNGQCSSISDTITLNLDDCIFDLALQKILTPTQQVPVYTGDLVTFEITVFNQGDVNAVDITVTDYIPPGFILADANWFSLGANEAGINIPGPLIAGSQTTVSITLQVTNPDIDSTPDNDNTNDNGGTPGVSGEDDEINDDGTIDEDDHDPAVVPVAIFDLALTKKLSPTQQVPVTIGSNVTYDIEVCNQGTVDAQNVEVVDYLPAGLTLNDPAWTLAANGNAYQTIPGPIAPGTCTTIQITCTVAAFPSSGQFQNFAEISEAEDGDGNNPPDIDSDPDDDDSNDGPVTDDDTNNTNGDEDDHDPAIIPVVQPMCNVSNNGL